VGRGDAGQQLPFEYAAFAEWYGMHCRSLLEPALQTFVRLLDEQLRQGVSELDRHRVRVAGSRIKAPLRVWSKLQKEPYRDRVTDFAEIPHLLDDLVGVRIVCNNLSDIALVQSMLATLPASEGLDKFGMATESDSEKLYVDHPKLSGYRAYHINLVTHVPGLNGLDLVRGELQVRTLLQDGWGELTHEDTYKPGVELPALVTTLSRRMADLLATVDDLAQDLRQELDRLAQSAVEETAAPEVVPLEHGGDELSGPNDASTRFPSRDLVVAETARIVANLSQPTSLASIAAILQGTFGTSIRPYWAGYKSFKALLLAAVPGVDIASAGPGYVIPPGSLPNSTWPKSLLDRLP
jgi:ppGpp synthetase/RelA/SpoT-type nucleotidyltranferase